MSVISFAHIFAKNTRLAVNNAGVTSLEAASVFSESFIERAVIPLALAMGWLSAIKDKAQEVASGTKFAGVTCFAYNTFRTAYPTTAPRI